MSEHQLVRSGGEYWECSCGAKPLYRGDTWLEHISKVDPEQYPRQLAIAREQQRIKESDEAFRQRQRHFANYQMSLWMRQNRTNSNFVSQRYDLVQAIDTVRDRIESVAGSYRELTGSELVEIERLRQQVAILYKAIAAIDGWPNRRPKLAEPVQELPFRVPDDAGAIDPPPTQQGEQ
jgi:hypothetical protein